tara:strand:+ start:15 stop:209 length:195 start_codon:yes stop_codon:yes gene_type:complete
MSHPTEKECKEAVDYYFDKMCDDNWVLRLSHIKWKHLKTLLNATAWNELYLDLRWEGDDDKEKE